jgi:hypothetical protein
MKKLSTLIFLALAFFLTNAQTPTLDIEFTTIDMGGFSHEKHVLAIWIETDAEEFVKTPLVYADVRKENLYTWNSPPANGNEVDAITGATQLEHKTYTITWDCFNLDSEVIPNGNYVLHIEMNNKHVQGPLAEINFTKGDESFTLNPDDEEFFKDISLDYKINAVSVDEKNMLKKEMLTIYPNPANEFVNLIIDLEADEEINIEIFNEKFQLVANIADSKNFYAGKNKLRWDIAKNIANGTYFVCISSKSHVWFGKKIIISR